jgi:hypothetical protein
VSSTDTENSTFISDNCATELWYIEAIVKRYFLSVLSINVPKMDAFATPFEVVHILIARVALLKDKGVVQKFSKPINDVFLVIICNATIKFPEFSHFEDQVFRNLLKLRSDVLKGLKVPLLRVHPQLPYVSFQFA